MIFVHYEKHKIDLQQKCKNKSVNSFTEIGEYNHCKSQGESNAKFKAMCLYILDLSDRNFTGCTVFRVYLIKMV